MNVALVIWYIFIFPDMVKPMKTFPGMRLTDGMKQLCLMMPCFNIRQECMTDGITYLMTSWKDMSPQFALKWADKVMYILSWMLATWVAPAVEMK